MRRYSFAALCCTCIVASAPAESKELKGLQDAVHKVIDEAKPSVACILVSRSERYRDFNALSKGPEGKLGSFDSRLQAPVGGDPARRELFRRLDLGQADSIPESYGSGVVLDASGLILTHFHVVQDATKIFVRLPGKKGSYADIYAADGRSDLAVLKLIDPPADLKPIRLGNADKAREGDFVVGVANPFSSGIRDGNPTSSKGIISKMVRQQAKNDAEVDLSKTIPQLGVLMQTDLRLDLECSGGAVLNPDGELIGLTTSMAAIVGGETPAGFAVPLTANIKRIIGVLRRGEEVEYGLLGVSIRNPNLADGWGVVIDPSINGWPARRAGLQTGEIITSVNGVPVLHSDDLLLQIGAALAASEVKLAVSSSFGDQSRKVTVKLAKFKNPSPVIASNRPAPVHGLRVDYTSAFSDAPLPEGVYIRDVERGSAAERKYKDLLDRARWIVTSVNGKPVAAPADFYREAAAVKGSLELKIVEATRNPDTTSRTLTLP